MDNLRFLYDEPQEAAWFRNLDSRLSNIPMARIGDTNESSKVSRVLSYDRPDIVLIDGNQPILVIEESSEVPSGHNVLQRFPRLAAAAENSVPCLYFGPYVAMKHGGETRGPRYVNLRLFKALARMSEITGSAVTTINWPVDSSFEIIRGAEASRSVREYMAMFLDGYSQVGFDGINELIIQSEFHRQTIDEQQHFSEHNITLRNRISYESPPDSVEIMSRDEFSSIFGVQNIMTERVLVYSCGTRTVRSDPYTGAAMAYDYLYVKGNDMTFVLRFQNLPIEEWKRVSMRDRKDIRLYRHAADVLVFEDGWKWSKKN